MLKKITLLAAAIAALAAFAMPTVANAQQLEQGGVPLAVGSEITATSTDLQTHTLLGTLSCTKMTLHMTVTANSTTTSAANAPKGQVTFDSCWLNESGAPHEGIPMTITNASFHVHLNAATTGKAGYTFMMDIPGQNPCHFQTNGTGANVTWATNTDIINVVTPISGNCGPAEVTGSFTVENAGGPVTIS